MILSSLIRKGGLAKLATATLATDATGTDESPLTVARVATVAVAEQSESTIDHPSVSTKLTPEEESKIRAWFASIDEHDELTIREYLENCERDPDALAYFLGRAAEVVKAERPPHGSAQCRD